jgi:hypothetical protein
MLIFKIELEEFEKEELDMYIRGHITVQGNSGIISSKLLIKEESVYDNFYIFIRPSGCC